MYHPYLQSGGGQQDVRGLHHVGSVDVVVVGHVCVVVVLQRHHEGDEGVRWDLKRLEQVSLLKRGRDKETRTDTHAQGTNRVSQY